MAEEDKTKSSVAAAIVDPNRCWIFVEFAGPGSAVVKGVHYGPGLQPTQLLVISGLLELEAKNSIIETRNRLAAAPNSLVIPK